MKLSNLKITGLVMVFMFLVSFQGSTPEPKKYQMSLTLKDWGRYSDGVLHTIRILRQSDLPARDVAYISDSVLVPLFTQMNEQVGRQVQDEKAKDSVDKKNATSGKSKKQ